MKQDQKTTPKVKSWKRYFLDFLMLFLAVFLGFFADNIRDQFTEQKKEKEYISSLLEDVKTDQKNIQIAIQANDHRKSMLDSLSQLCFNYEDKKSNLIEFYRYYIVILNRPDFFTPNELTIQQLKNAGGMRLIKDKEVVQEIFKYDLNHKKLLDQQKYYVKYQNNCINLGMKIVSSQPLQKMKANYKKTGKMVLDVSTLKLVQKDPLILTEFANIVSMYGGIVEYYNMLLKETIQQSESLISKLESAYQIE